MRKKEDSFTAYLKRIQRRGGLRWPHKLPKGRVLVHNHVMHTEFMHHGANGFRCWTQNFERSLVRCKCGWRGVEHYRVRGMGSDKCYTSAECYPQLAEFLERGAAA
jgi:hypothetical protein